ncbi:MAG: HDIG domain-containing metalloprotein [Desulfohalobiaceae bacterium]
MTRDQALQLLQDNCTDKQLLQHSLQTEAVMAQLAKRMEHDPGLWSLTGLLHDLDYSWTKDKPEKHGLLAAQMLQEDLPQEALQAIKAHNSEMTGILPSNTLDYALRCGESVTGLIWANALVRPQGMEGMKPKSLKKKMQDKSFAANVSRERIRECENIGLELGEFLQICIQAMSELKQGTQQHEPR